PAHHDRIGAASQRFANVASSAHPAVSDNRHITRCFLEVSIARGRAIHSRSYLRHTESENTAGGAGSPRPHADQNRSRPAFHDFESHIVAHCVSNDNRNAHLTAKFFKIK